MNWDYGLERWMSSAVVYENHRPGRLPALAKFTKEIIDSLVSKGHITHEGEICNAKTSVAWNSLPFPNFNGELRPHVVGLRVFARALQCTVEVDRDICGHITSSINSFRNHLSDDHGRGHSAEYTEVSAQTLSEDKGWVSFFEVSPTATLPTFDGTTRPIDASGLDLETARGLLQQTTANYMNDLNVIPDLNVKTILPVFVETGIDQFLRPFNRKHFRRRYDPDPDHPTYSTLRNLILETYKEGIKGLTELKLPSNIFLLMTNCTP
jgi:hypothetical protein